MLFLSDLRRAMPGLFLLFTTVNFGQIAEWTFENFTSSVPELPIPATSAMSEVQLAMADMIGATNIGSPDYCFGNESWATNFWPTTAERNTSAYLEFVVTAAGDNLEVTSFQFYSNLSSANGPLYFDVYYQKSYRPNEVFLFSGSNSPGDCDAQVGFFPIPQKIDWGTSMYFRVYPYGATSGAAAASMRMDNVAINGAVLLPVKLTAFSAQPAADGIQLQWTVAEEIDNDYFAVERSRNGLVFTDIGRIEGRGTSSLEQTYVFADADPYPGRNYYRLRQVDFDGTTTYFNIIDAEAAGSAGQWEVFPTPTRDVLYLSLATPAKEDMWVELRDASGRLVQHTDLARRQQQVDLSVQQLPSGLYTVHLHSARGVESRRWMKL